MFWAVLPLAIFILIKFFLKREFDLKPLRLAKLSVAFVLCIIGLARPQTGKYEGAEKTVRSDVYLVIDISQSMLAKDVSPSRLHLAILIAGRLLQLLNGTRIALFPFANDGYLYMPLTTDLETAGSILSTFTPSMMSDQGTDLNSTLQSLWNTIEQTKTPRTVAQKQHVQVILISDGESHLPLKDELPYRFKSRGIPIHVIGVGSKSGTQVAVTIKGEAAAGGFSNDTQTIVHTRKDSATLKRLSRLSGGYYFDATLDVLPTLTNYMLKSNAMGTRRSHFLIYKEYYPYFFLAGLFLFLSDFLMRKWHYAIRLLFLVLLFNHEVYADSKLENQYRQTVNQKRRSLLGYNLGVLYQRKGFHDKATEYFQESAYTSTDPALKKKALFNLGNSLFQLGDFKSALLAYQEAYDMISNQQAFDKDANLRISENIALASKLLDQMKKKASQDGEGEDEVGSSNDTKGPKKFLAERFSHERKQKIFDLIENEEQQIIQRLQGNKTAKRNRNKTDKPW